MSILSSSSRLTTLFSHNLPSLLPPLLLPLPRLAPYDPTPTPHPGLYPTFPVLKLHDELSACLARVRTRIQQPKLYTHHCELVTHKDGTAGK